MKFFVEIPIYEGQEGNVPPQFANQLRSLIAAAFSDIVCV